MSQITVIDTSNVNLSGLGDSIFQNRETLSYINNKYYKSDVTIYIQGYNNVNKVKNCINSVLKYTQGIDYDLILVDNGSVDETFEYFKSIEFDKKTIIRFTKNCGPLLPHLYIGNELFSKYAVFLTDDLVVTSNWLSNMLRIAESDPKIGMVNPMSSNASNYQGVYFDFSDYDEMQEKAAKFNVSNPQKWHERMRLLTLGTLYRKECLYTIGHPITDVGFTHNFADDDITFRVRRAGYKAILAKDTWIHHDDNKLNPTIEQAIKINRDLDIGRENFKTKYFGIDAWDDVNNFINEYIGELKPVASDDGDRILGIDVRCGTPVLEIKNYLRSFDIFDAECFAFTTAGKYFLDLQTVCGADNVYCGDINTFPSYFDRSSFDQIVIGEEVNTYIDPFRVIKNAFELLKDNGQLFFSVKNTLNMYALIYAAGGTDIRNPVHAVNYTAEEFLSRLLQEGYDASFIAAGYMDPRTISSEMTEMTESILKKLAVKEINETMFRLKSERFYFTIRK